MGGGEHGCDFAEFRVRADEGRVVAGGRCGCGGGIGWSGFFGV